MHSNSFSISQLLDILSSQSYFVWWHFVQWLYFVQIYFALWHFLQWYFVWWHFVQWHFVQLYFAQWPVIFCLVTFCPVVFYLVAFCSVAICPVTFCPGTFCPKTFCPRTCCLGSERDRTAEEFLVCDVLSTLSDYVTNCGRQCRANCLGYHNLMEQAMITWYIDICANTQYIRATFLLSIGVNSFDTY